MPDMPPGQEHDGIWIPAGAKLPSQDEPAADAEIVAEPDAEPEPDWHDRYLRALADADNIRRRAAEQNRLATERANVDFLEKLLPVVDGFARARAAAEQNPTVESLAQGLALLAGQFDSFLQSVGVTPIPCAVGDPFDPEVHEAVVRLEPTEAVGEGCVAGVLEAGWLLHGRVLRPARVAVAGSSLDAEAD